ncbi:MAG: ATP-binding cassette domain-containing protein [Kofleriaceae bacterium]
MQSSQAVLSDSRYLLELSSFGVAFADRIVLADVTLHVERRGTCVIMGPAGGGKSTLLRALAGVNHAQPDLRQWGSARFDGVELVAGGARPMLVQQDARYFTSTVRENLVSALPNRSSLDRVAQAARIHKLLVDTGAEDLVAHLDDDALGLSVAHRRLLSVIRAAGSDAPLICLDESTAGLDEAGSARILRVIRWYAREHAVLFVTHHQGHAREVADEVVLLAGGRVQQQASSREFFAGEGAPIVRHFLDSGGVKVASPNANPEDLSDDVAQPPPLPPGARLPSSAPSASVGPRDFRWILPGQLGGLPRPGIVASLESDLAGLRRLGVCTLVNLEETITVPVDALAAAGIEAIHFAITDMEAPELAAAAEWCKDMEERLHQGQVIAVHCRAGQGRTGTMLASQLIWTGVSPVEALELVRGVNPRWVTSEVQVAFLARFHSYLQSLPSWTVQRPTDGSLPSPES